MRVVITGVGALSPLGVGVAALWEALLAGRHGIRGVTAFDASGFDVQLGGEVPGFEPGDFMAPETTARFGRTTQFAIAASKMALKDSGLTEPDTVAAAGLCLGTTMGEIQELEAACAGQEGRLRRYPVSQIGASVAEVLGLSGPNIVIPTACAAGNYSIGHAVDLLRDGRAKTMLAGGVDVMAEIQFVGFQRLRSMAPDVPRPFSAGREGMMVSEGAGVLVLEPFDEAVARGARIYAEVLGYGLSCDAHHMTAPHPDGAGAFAAMTAALRDAGLQPDRISYVNAHGTGTPANDRIETLAIKRLLGDRAQRIPVTSIKAMLGHTMGAASALEAIVTALIVHHGVIPPTTNYLGPDPDCDLDYVIDGPRRQDIAIALSNSYAFGGNNASLVVGCLT
jgi:3-oxoacyl-[acyl-carrier-protein] synthase II